ncbi:MAG: ATP-binding protein, partial [Gemmatimonadota bacterium]
AQDSTGFVWAGTIGGLYRYDGVGVRRWAADRVRGRVRGIAVLASGRVLAVEESGELWRVEGERGVRVEGPSGDGLTDVLDMCAGGDGSLWVLREGGRLLRRGADGGWREIPLPDRLRGEAPRHLFLRGDAAVDLSTARALWEVRGEDDVRRVAGIPRVTDVLSLPSGERVVVTFWRDTYLLSGDEPRKVADPPGRGIAAALRGDVVWIAYDRYLARLGPEGGTRVLGPAEGLIDGAGPLLVDHERSLWTGTQAGLVQLPEPETEFWADAHGLPSAHTRFVTRAGDSLWVATWQGAGWLEPQAAGWRADTVRGWISRGELVVDSEGDVWTGSDRGLLELRAGREPAVHHPDIASLRAVADGEGDVLWLGAEAGVYRATTGGFGRGTPPRRAPGLDVPDDVHVTAVLRDEEGRLWAGVEERICRVDAADAATAPAADWTCWSFPGAVHFSSFHQTDGGSVWAASPYAGVLRHRGGRWDTLPGVSELPSRSVLNLVPSPSGGVWMVGHAIIQRVVPDPDAPDGWRVLERLSAWHGLPSSGAEDVHEDPDGTLWIATSRGLVRVPPTARHRSPSPPEVALVEARVDDEPLDLADTAELSHDRNRIELRFAALSYRARSRLRYQVRLVPGTGWSDARSQPVVRWVGLEPGLHRAEIRATLDGSSWTPEPASFGFAVAPPWYRQPRWMAVFGLAVALLALLVYRARVAHLLDLERQRTRIAMDLHDEMGAALGSIGIQAGMLGGSGVEGPRRARIARDVADTAGELGTTLADIVWSLDPRASTLGDLGLRLEERARRLFAGGGTRLVVGWPDRWPDDELPATVRRNVLLVGLEALQNAARHADADLVVLSMARVRPGTWRLSVADDGSGMDAVGAETSPDAAGGGMGLRSMRARADEIEADVEWRRRDEGGTRVVLTFPLQGRRPLRDRVGAWGSRLAARMIVLMRRR